MCVSVVESQGFSLIFMAKVWIDLLYISLAETIPSFIVRSNAYSFCLATIQFIALKSKATKPINQIAVVRNIPISNATHSSVYIVNKIAYTTYRFTEVCKSFLLSVVPSYAA